MPHNFILHCLILVFVALIRPLVLLASLVVYHVVQCLLHLNDFVKMASFDPYTDGQIYFHKQVLSTLTVRVHFIACVATEKISMHGWFTEHLETYCTASIANKN